MIKKRIIIYLIPLLVVAYCIFGGSSFPAAAQPTPTPSPAPTPEPTPEPYADGFDICGRHYCTSDEELDLTGISSESDASVFEDVMPYMKGLKRVILGSEDVSPVSWEMIKRLQAAAPGTEFDYSFSLYGEPMTLNTDYIDLRKIKVTDEGQAVSAALPCMKQCTYLDMDESGLSDEQMVAIRDSFPDIKVVWRVTYSTLGYSSRTDVKTILASLTGVGEYAGFTYGESIKPLTYFTDLVNLDLGHNGNLRDISFLEYMPKLETLILFEDYVRDITPLASCKNLRYLELYGNSMKDISPVAELENLEYLELACCYNVNDISPIIPADKLPKLKRFFCYGVIPEAQIDEFARNHPGCEINTTDTIVGDYWRFKTVPCGNSPENRTPMYQEMCDIFHYPIKEYGYPERSNYNFSTNDPYYTTPHGEPVKGIQLEWFYGQDSGLS